MLAARYDTDHALGLVVAPARRGLTLLEVLVSTTVMVLLLGILLPAVQHSREAARRAGCQGNLHQIGLAMNVYQQRHGVFPPGQEPVASAGGRGTGAGWAVHLLPALGEQSLYAELDFTSDMTFTSAGEVNRDVVEKPLGWFVCTASGRGYVAGRAAIGYVGNRGTQHSPDADDGVLFDRSRISAAAVRDGLGHTILLAEVLPGEPGEPGRTPASWCGWQMAHVAPAGPINDPEGGPERFRSNHPGGIVVLMCDGTTRFLSEQIDARFDGGRTRGVLGALLTRAGREPLNDRDF